MRLTPEQLDQAACKNLPIDIFMPTNPGGPDTSHYDNNIRLAKSVCARCPIRVACLAEALEHEYPSAQRRPGNAYQQQVVAGGMTTEERRAERDRRARGQLSLLTNDDTPAISPVGALKVTRKYAERRAVERVDTQINQLFNQLREDIA